MRQPCNDGDICTLGDACVDGACSAGGSDLTCDDGNLCTDDTCDATLGCVFTANDADCDDTNSCTTADVCTQGACIGSGSLECDDGNPCTIDTCLVQGGCSYANSQGICDDGDACTLGDICSEGTCTSGDALSCDDSNPCTDEVCDQGDCVFTPNAADCDDLNACTPTSTCSEGACLGQGALDCDDGVVCTNDGCDPASGCAYQDNQAPCDDGDICSIGDTCSSGNCAAGAVTLTCDDGNTCTTDTCDAATGCNFEGNALPCDDGNACTSGDTCLNKACIGPEPVDCSDEEACTDEGCDPLDGCQITFNNVICDDGDACTVGDACADGACVSGEGTLPCDDGLFCNGSEGCDAQLGCEAGQAPTIDDGIACTVDVCDNDQGQVIHTPDASQCPLDPNATCQVAVCDLQIGCTTEVVANCCGNGIIEEGEDCDDNQGCPANCKVAQNCKQLQEAGEAESGVYTIDPDGLGGVASFDVYCDMDNHGGGWTLVLMTQSDDHEILKYESALWSNDETLNAGLLDPNTNNTMKSQAYSTVAFDKVRFDLVSIGNSHLADVSKSSTKELLNGDHIDVPYNRDNFLAWVPENPSEWNNQPCCNIKGIQAHHGDVAKCRYGILMNNECHECHSSDAAVGFGCFTNANDAPQVRRISAGAFRWQPDVRFNHRGWIWVR